MFSLYVDFWVWHLRVWVELLALFFWYWLLFFLVMRLSWLFLMLLWFYVKLEHSLLFFNKTSTNFPKSTFHWFPFLTLHSTLVFHLIGKKQILGILSFGGIHQEVLMGTVIKYKVLERYIRTKQMVAKK